MLDGYLKRKDVKNFIEELRNNPKFYHKKFFEQSSYGKDLDNELALYTFYESLYKYKVVVDDVYFFDGFFDQIKKIYRKMDKIQDIEFGVHKALCNIVSISLGINDLTIINNREEIIKYFYNKYILNGYYIHGFNTIYENEIKINGFVPDTYNNNYASMKKIDEIFTKYGYNNIMHKDFNNNKIAYFTDNFVGGCYYSATSPRYFYNLLFNEDVYGKVRKKGYLFRDYVKSISFLKKKISKFTLEEQNTITSIVDAEWEKITRVPKKISLLLVKRNIINSGTKVNLDEFLKMSGSIYEVVDSILCSKSSSVILKHELDSLDCNVISLDDYYETKKDKEVKSMDFIPLEDSNKPLNAYGVVSTFIVIGAFVISLGVLITVIMLFRGI